MKRTFNIQVTVEERWVNDFCSFLKYLESLGNIGHSGIVAFYADGDGDFCPKFEIDTEFTQKEGFTEKDCDSGHLGEPEVIFDAG